MVMSTTDGNSRGGSPMGPRVDAIKFDNGEVLPALPARSVCRPPETTPGKITIVQTVKRVKAREPASIRARTGSICRLQNLRLTRNTKRVQKAGSS